MRTDPVHTFQSHQAAPAQDARPTREPLPVSDDVSAGCTEKGIVEMGSENVELSRRGGRRSGFGGR